MTLERKILDGKIARGEESFAVDFHVSVVADFRLKIEVDLLPIQTLFRLQGAIEEPEGQASDGAMFFSG